MNKQDKIKKVMREFKDGKLKTSILTYKAASFNVAASR